MFSDLMQLKVSLLHSVWPVYSLCVSLHARPPRCSLCVLRACTHPSDYAGRQTTEVWDTNDAAGCTGNSFQWHGQEAYHCATTNEYSVAWNYGANFGGPTKATWTSGANSLTSGNPGSLTGSGMFSTHYVADPNYGTEDGDESRACLRGCLTLPIAVFLPFPRARRRVVLAAVW